MDTALDLILHSRRTMSGGVIPGAIYVAPYGNDAYTGSLLQPVKTLDRAGALVSAGGTIAYFGGVHTCPVVQNITTNGTISNRITICPVPGHKPIIDGSGPQVGAQHLFFIDGDYITVKDLEIRNSTRDGIVVYQAVGVIVENCYVHGCWQAGIMSEGTTNASNDGTIIRKCFVERNVRHNLTGAAGYGQGISLSIGQNGIVEDCIVTRNMGEGIGLQKGHSGGTVRRNISGDNYKINMYNDACNNSTFDRNFCFATGFVETQVYGTGARPNGFTWSRETGSGAVTGLKVTNNIFANCNYGMLYFIQLANAGYTGAVIAGNTIANPITAGIRIEGGASAANNTISNNIFHSDTGVPAAAGDWNGYFTDYNLFSGCPPIGGHYLTGDPLFANPSGTLSIATDFALQSGSPAKGAGTTVAALTTDYFGNTRSGADSLGAAWVSGSAYAWPTPPTHTRVMYTESRAVEVVSTEIAAQQELVSVTFTPEASTDYWVIWSGELQSSATTSAAKLIVYENNSPTNLDHYYFKPQDTVPAEWSRVTSFFKWTSPVSPVPVQFAVKVASQSVGQSARGRYGNIVVIKKIATDEFVETTAQTSMTTSEATFQTLTWTPASTKDYLIIGTCLSGATPNTPTAATIRLYDEAGPTKVSECYAQPIANFTNNADIPATVGHYAAGRTAVSQSFTLRGVHSHATAGIIANRRILALDVTGSVLLQNSATLAADGTTNNTASFVDSTSYSPSIAATQQHIVFMFGGATINSTTVSGYIKSMIDGNEVGQMVRENGVSTQFQGNSLMWVGSLPAGTRVIKQQAANESGTVAVGTKAPKYIVWPIEPADAPLVADFYISPSGNDTTGDGSIGNPYKTLPKLNGIAGPGDLIYMRGGTYDINTNRGWFWNTSGTAGNLIRIWAYPGEVPIIDATNCTAATSTYPGLTHAGGNALQCSNVSYCHFRGIRVRKAPMDGWQWIGENGGSCIGNTVEICVTSENGRNGEVGNGLVFYEHCDFNLILNHDSWGNLNSVGNGTNSDGYQLSTWGGNNNVARYCRSWGNGDDGYDLVSLFTGQVHGGWLIDTCWSWENGYLIDGTTATAGDGRGFKPGYVRGVSAGAPTFRNCLGWSNKVAGIDENDNDTQITLYNSTFWNNNRSNTSPTFYGNVNLNKTGAAAHLARNNISFAPAFGLHAKTTGSTSDHNTWDLAITPTSGHFLSIDPTIAKGPRNSDGSLPVSNFLKLAPGAPEIDVGVNVGLPFNGAAPDLGAYEAA